MKTNVRASLFPISIISVILIPTILSAAVPPGPLVPHPVNSQYLMVQGDPQQKAIYLTGSHTWHEFQDYQGDPIFPYSTWINDLANWGHNFMRGWHWEDGYYSPLPYLSVGPDYDLTQYNQAYYDRLKTRIEDAGAQGLYVGVMLFEGWSVDNGYSSGNPGGYRSPNPWPVHPYDDSNNINGINGDPNSDNDGGETHQLIISAVTNLQKDYIEHTIDQLNYLDNIVWEISNESRAFSVAWQYQLVDHIKSYEAANYGGHEHLVWMNARGDWNNSSLFSSSCHADIVSPNDQNNLYFNSPPVPASNKIVILDSDHIRPVDVTYPWVWKGFTRGNHVLIMDPAYDGLSWWQGSSLNPSDPKWNRMRTAQGHTLTYANKMNLTNVTAQNGGTSPASTGYCLYESGEDYIVYQSGSGSFTVNLPAATYDYDWIHPYNGLQSSGTFVWAGGNKSLTPPFGGDAVIYITKGGSPVAIIDANPTIGFSPLSVNFDGSNSYDTDGNIVLYEWDFTNDGSFDATGVTASHEYVGVNEYTALLKVTDNIGLTGTDTVNISVVHPLGDFNGDEDVDQEDFGHLQECLTGLGNPQNDPNCQDAKLDIDEDVDLDDFNLFQACMSGANVPQTDPGCIPN
ncbi:MAG: PKD domain-containing protein [Planctomycetota bacterium]